MRVSKPQCSTSTVNCKTLYKLVNAIPQRRDIRPSQLVDRRHEHHAGLGKSKGWYIKIAERDASGSRAADQLREEFSYKVQVLSSHYHSHILNNFFQSSSSLSWNSGNREVNRQIKPAFILPIVECQSGNRFKVSALSQAKCRDVRNKSTESLAFDDAVSVTDGKSSTNDRVFMYAVVVDECRRNNLLSTKLDSKEGKCMCDYAGLSPWSLTRQKLQGARAIGRPHGATFQNPKMLRSVSCRWIERLVPTTTPDERSPEKWQHDVIQDDGRLVPLSLIPDHVKRNISPRNMCNGTRLLIKDLKENLIVATILTDPAAGQLANITRIPMIPTDLPISFKRLQFPHLFPIPGHCYKLNRPCNDGNGSDCLAAASQNNLVATDRQLPSPNDLGTSDNSKPPHQSHTGASFIHVIHPVTVPQDPTRSSHINDPPQRSDLFHSAAPAQNDPQALNFASLKGCGLHSKNSRPPRAHEVKMYRRLALLEIRIQEPMCDEISFVPKRQGSFLHTPLKTKNWEICYKRDSRAGLRRQRPSPASVTVEVPVINDDAIQFRRTTIYQKAFKLFGRLQQPSEEYHHPRDLPLLRPLPAVSGVVKGYQRLPILPVGERPDKKGELSVLPDLRWNTPQLKSTGCQHTGPTLSRYIHWLENGWRWSCGGFINSRSNHEWTINTCRVHLVWCWTTHSMETDSGIDVGCCSEKDPAKDSAIDTTDPPNKL
ncbi:hypothetical protein PR048_009000 [Dryococelus australis]|uniref:ATP-dependent DNA helicase n=1 Tax=Dryococelus australis TaxID=614101 RepID=A0ABQ9HYN8_9NEOP|nr:hypothetical protein PR048_009000 [Dryococelus australis]